MKERNGNTQYEQVVIKLKSGKLVTTWRAKPETVQDKGPSRAVPYSDRRHVEE